jgi:hypothetical protein
LSALLFLLIHKKKKRIEENSYLRGSVDFLHQIFLLHTVNQNRVSEDVVHDDAEVNHCLQRSQLAAPLQPQQRPLPHPGLREVLHDGLIQPGGKIHAPTVEKENEKEEKKEETEKEKKTKGKK